MNVRFLTLAQQEIDETVVWFNERQQGKGLEFLAELDLVVRLIMTYPFSSPEIEPEIRRCLFFRFPYSLIYGIEADTVVVIAVSHTHREPRYWIDRF